METNNNSLRDRLLAGTPQPGDLSSYREQVSAAIAANQKRIRRERTFTTAFWIFCAVTATARLWFGAGAAALPREPFIAIIFFVWGGVEVVKHHINASRIEMLKELKQLQIQVFELQASGGPRSTQ